MQIFYKSKKDMVAFTQEIQGDKRWGLPLAKRIRQRIKEFEAALSLAEISHLPPLRCHILKGNRSGQYAVDVSQNKRLIFEPANLPDKLPDGGNDLHSITTITILEVIDYHGE
ncbi:killer suppression protein HigA [Aminivibrio sp.]